jgi:hypothetical protein
MTDNTITEDEAYAYGLQLHNALVDAYRDTMNMEAILARIKRQLRPHAKRQHAKRKRPKRFRYVYLGRPKQAKLNRKEIRSHHDRGIAGHPVPRPKTGGKRHTRRRR